MSDLREKVTRAMANKDIVPIEDCGEGMRILDYLRIEPKDFPDLGLNPVRDLKGKPIWHWQSDVRDYELGDALNAILSPLADAAIAVCMEEAAKTAGKYACGLETGTQVKVAKRIASALRTLDKRLGKPGKGE